MATKFSQDEREELLKTMSDLIYLSGREGIDDDLKKRLIDDVLAMCDQLKSRLIMDMDR
jgi:hypothetical protein